MSERDRAETNEDRPSPDAVKTPAASGGEAGARPEPTVGTGSVFAIGCVILLVIAVVVLGAVFLRP